MGLDVMVLPKWTKVFFIAAINFDINVRAMPCHKGQYSTSGSYEVHPKS
jgi:hypothetical protein